MAFYFQCTPFTVVSITFLSDIFEKEQQKGHCPEIQNNNKATFKATHDTFKPFSTSTWRKAQEASGFVQILTAVVRFTRSF
jgi:hypothetical protein